MPCISCFRVINSKPRESSKKCLMTTVSRVGPRSTTFNSKMSSTRSRVKIRGLCALGLQVEALSSQVYLHTIGVAGFGAESTSAFIFTMDSL